MVTLDALAHARSGDKGNHANIGVLAYTQAGYEYLSRVLTPELVKDYFAPLGITSVERYALPRIQAFNFVLRNALGGGASRSPRIDTQGKLLGTALLEMSIPRPPNLSAMTRSAKPPSAPKALKA